MSRICVKNLPIYVVEDRLRELFSHKGEITDVNLMRTKDGRSRQLAFIGFRTDREAQEAIQYFNKSYLDTSKIICEVAQGLGDTNLPCPWSRYSKNKENEVTTPDANKHARTKAQGDKSKDIVDINDTQLQDFLQVMQPRTRGKLWANDTLIVSNVGNNQGVSNKDSKGTSDSSEDTCGKGVTNDKAQVKQEGHSSNPEDEKGVFESSRLFVRNLPYTTTVEELQNHVEENLQKHFSKLKRVRGSSSC